jgi:hypothetical protein
MAETGKDYLQYRGCVVFFSPILLNLPLKTDRPTKKTMYWTDFMWTISRFQQVFNFYGFPYLQLKRSLIFPLCFVFVFVLQNRYNCTLVAAHVNLTSVCSIKVHFYHIGHTLSASIVFTLPNTA